MARIDLSQLTRPAVVTETREFRDERYPDMPLVVTLKCAGEFGDLQKINALTEYYFAEHGGKMSIPIQLGGTDVPDIPITRELCLAVATIMSMQSGEDQYDFAEWVKISVAMAGAFGQVIKFTRDILAATAAKPERGPDGKVPVPNDSAASTAQSSELP